MTFVCVGVNVSVSRFMLSSSSFNVNALPYITLAVFLVIDFVNPCGHTFILLICEHLLLHFYAFIQAYHLSNVILVDAVGIEPTSLVLQTSAMTTSAKRPYWWKL